MADATPLFGTPWIRARVRAELAEANVPEDALRPFPRLPGWETHFVIGEDKLGVLWSLDVAFVEGEAPRVFVGVRFHEAAAHLGGMVHGGASSAIIDAFAAACGVVTLKWNLTAVTKDQTVHFLRPLKLETDYFVAMRPEPGAEEITDASRQVVVTGTIGDEAGKPRLRSRTLMVVPAPR